MTYELEKKYKGSNTRSCNRSTANCEKRNTMKWKRKKTVNRTDSRDIHVFNVARRT